MSPKNSLSADQLTYVSQDEQTREEALRYHYQEILQLLGEDPER